jgi:tetratricopeptide (TPR) repeat protein
VISTRVHLLGRNSERLAAAEALTLEALAAEPRNAMAHYWLGLIFLFSRRAEPAIAELEQALALDRNLTFAHAQIGLAKAILGRAEETEGHVMEAMRLSPRENGAYVWCDFLAIADIMLGREAEALPWCRRSVEGNRNYSLARLHYAAALALCGRTEAHSRGHAACGRAGGMNLISPDAAPSRVRLTQDLPLRSIGRFVVLEGGRSRRLLGRRSFHRLVLFRRSLFFDLDRFVADELRRLVEALIVGTAAPFSRGSVSRFVVSRQRLGRHAFHLGFGPPHFK